MNARQFFTLTAEVRELQKICDGEHDLDDITLLKLKEQALDAEIARVQAIPPEALERLLKQRETVNTLFNRLNLSIDGNQ